MKAYGGEIMDRRVIEKFFVSLTETFDMVMSIIEESKDLSRFSVTQLVGSTPAQKQRISGQVEASYEGTFQSRARIDFHPMV